MKEKDESSLYKKYVSGREDSIRAACREGAVDKDLTTLLGCGKTTLYKIKKESPEFCELLKESKAVADFKVENALYKRATGFDYVEVSTSVSPTGEVTQKRTIKHVAPDTGAAMAWLKNRKPEKWRDKHDVEITNPFEELMKSLPDNPDED